MNWCWYHRADPTDAYCWAAFGRLADMAVVTVPLCAACLAMTLDQGFLYYQGECFRFSAHDTRPYGYPVADREELARLLDMAGINRYRNVTRPW